MSIVERLRQARKARLQRIAARAAAQPAPGMPVRNAFSGHGDCEDERAWAVELLGAAPPVSRRCSKPGIEDVQRATERHFGLEPGALVARPAMAATIRQRQVAMYLARELTAKSYPEIGRRFGGRIHPTVLRAVRKIDGLLGRDDELAASVAAIRAALARREP